jgi:hypothetical protein
MIYMPVSTFVSATEEEWKKKDSKTRVQGYFVSEMQCSAYPFIIMTLISIGVLSTTIRRRL